MNFQEIGLDSLPRAVILPILPKVEANIDCMAGLMAVIEPDTLVLVNCVKSCWRDERLVAVAAADVAGIEQGDIKFGIRLKHSNSVISTWYCVFKSVNYY